MDIKKPPQIAMQMAKSTTKQTSCHTSATVPARPNADELVKIWYKAASICKRLNLLMNVLRPLLLLLLLTLGACSPAPQPMQLHQIYQRDTLRVGVLNGPTSYFVTPEGPTGYEYELAQALADKMGVKLTLVSAFHIDELLVKLGNGELDLIASGSTVSEALQRQYRLAPAYKLADEVLVYGQRSRRPKSLAELNKPITVLKGSSQAETLLALKSEMPELQIELNDTDDPSELLQKVAEGKIAYTLADSHMLAINQRFYPNPGIALTLKKQQPVAWLLPKNSDDSLYTVLIEFFGRSYAAADLLTLEDKYFGHVRRFNYADTLDFISAIDKTLPRYHKLFRQHAGNFDWRLLAALAYQESRWDPKARSPQGVVGMMMLTVDTANLMNVSSRVDAAQSIRGGSQYLQRMLDKTPDRISMPDRLWFALAAYNIGFSHVASARRLTEVQGANPDNWAEVKQRLPLLRQRKFYSQTRTGYARGDMAVYYVENIRRYYDTLLWIDEKKQAERRLEQTAKQGLTNQSSPAKSKALNTKNTSTKNTGTKNASSKGAGAKASNSKTKTAPVSNNSGNSTES